MMINVEPPMQYQRRDYHVVPHMGQWNVRQELENVVEARFRTQLEAMAYAIQLARHDAVSMVLHGRNGRIREVRSYDNFQYDDRPIIMDVKTGAERLSN